jgi:acetyl-CoA decarbonylase/synthase complex subunit delta
MEYGYSVMERTAMAALVQQDDALQQPMISFFGEDIWKCKEANLPAAENPELGDAQCRGVLMEVTEAIAVLAAGVSILAMRHPASVQIVKEYIKLAYDGGAVGGGLPEVPITKF